MAKQKGHVKAKGTVDDNLNFYKSEVWGYLLRLLLPLKYPLGPSVGYAILFYLPL